MLSPRDDDYDDSHLCIKCNTTIIGLENYVKHRKERCGKLSKTLLPKPPTTLPLDALDPSAYSLGADIFFQSLELQSSVKKTSLARLTPPISISKASTDRKLEAIASTSRDLPRMSPMDTNLRGEDWIGGHSLRISTNEDNQTKLINAVANISGSVKKYIPSTSYDIGVFGDFKGDEESDETEDSDEEEDDDMNIGGSKWKPPPNYTGGKWRPASPEQEAWILKDESEHTGGKWKPVITETNDRDEDYFAPPPSHTKGKWIPGAQDRTQIMQATVHTKGTTQYWCGPCNRRLGSKIIYEKHLRSNLHYKKVMPERDLEYAGHLETVSDVRTRSATSGFLAENTYVEIEKSCINIEPQLSGKKKRKRRKCFIHCTGCKSRVRAHLMGKHLISHYHFRKSRGPKGEAYQQLILNNIDAIVYQSPFQCSPCKFYTNWLSSFLQHWYSEEHKSRMLTVDGKYWCSFCKFECEFSEEMLDHMSGSEHSEVVSVINRSMPIIIRKKTILKCETCFKVFRYNIEIKKHCKITGHTVAHTATDVYQEFYKCKLCFMKFKSSLSLASHLKFKHDQKAYVCLVCEKTFETSEQAKCHRQTSEHRVRRKEKMGEKGMPIKSLSKKCPYCVEKVVLINIVALKDHIRRVHPNVKKTCPKCGMSFIFSQEVTRHVRNNACKYQDPNPFASVLWNCSQCLFTTSSQAECFYHEVLHSSPIIENQDNGKTLEKYHCPLCRKIYRKQSLRLHLRQHTFERPFACNICNANFTRQSSLSNHLKSEHSDDVKSLKPKLSTIIEVEEIKTLPAEKTPCRKCKKDFFSKSELAKHLADCNGDETRRCLSSDCSYVASSAAQLTRHSRVHGEKTSHKCTECDFKSSKSSHMKRHMLCHEGIKPYACPHCSFTCGSLENLRKHVLRSGRHIGLHLYYCSSCEYSTNMATELRSHLVNNHPDSFNTTNVIQAVKMVLLKDQSKTNS